MVLQDLIYAEEKDVTAEIADECLRLASLKFRFLLVNATRQVGNYGVLKEFGLQDSL